MDSLLTTAALAALPDATAIADRTGTLVFVNPAFRALTGCAEGDAVPTDAAVFAGLLGAIEAGRAFARRDPTADVAVVPLAGPTGAVTHCLVTHRLLPDPSAGAPPQPGRRGRVLVIDDEPMVARALERTLAPEHDVAIAGTARDALARIAHGERFDVIYCDIALPDMTGLALHAALAELEPAAAARIIFLYGGSQDEAAIAYLRSIPNPHVSKPFDTRQIRAITRERLEAA